MGRFTKQILFLSALTLGALAAGASGAEAQSGQTPPAAVQTPPDSLLEALTRLRARLDSLEAALEELAEEQDLPAWANRFRTRQATRGGAERGPGAAARELEALRAAARARVPDQPADSTQQPSVMRSRNLSALNPEISVTGDVRLNGREPGPQENNVELREFQFSVQSALDPYSTAKVFFSLEDGEVGLEEAYATWTGLPGAMRMELGRFRQQRVSSTVGTCTRSRRASTLWSSTSTSERTAWWATASASTPPFPSTVPADPSTRSTARPRWEATRSSSPRGTGHRSSYT
jgi:hypothetical protein